MSDLPIVCTLQPAELVTRAKQLLPGLVAAATSRSRIDGGYRFEFTATSESLGAISAAIDAERQCCRFLRFELVVEPDGGAMSLQVSGPPGAAEFLADLLPLA